MNTPIIITLPAEYIPINVVPTTTVQTAQPKMVKKLPELAEKPPALATATSDDDCSSLDEFTRGKKRRLDHLTWEEKMQRKKLKNRVAAQTSRDRKKAKMEEMEKTIQEQAEHISELQGQYSELNSQYKALDQNQAEQINKLRNRCKELADEKDELHQKYRDLSKRFDELQKRLDDKATVMEQSKNDGRHRVDGLLGADDDGGSVGCVTAGRQSGSAASHRCPQQQGLNKGGPAEAQTTLPPSPSDERLSTLWKIIAICLLCRTYSKASTCPSSKSLPKAYSQMSAQSWKALIAQAARRMPKVAAPASACLDQWWGPQQNSWNPVDRLPGQLVREAA